MQSTAITTRRTHSNRMIEETERKKILMVTKNHFSMSVPTRDRRIIEFSFQSCLYCTHCTVEPANLIHSRGRTLSVLVRPSTRPTRFDHNFGPRTVRRSEIGDVTLKVVVVEIADRGTSDVVENRVAKTVANSEIFHGNSIPNLTISHPVSFTSYRSATTSLIKTYRTDPNCFRF